MEQINIFNKRYVYFEWDEILLDKEVIIADDIFTLKRDVNLGEKGAKIHYTNNVVAPFNYDNGDIFGKKFAYYDPNYEVKIAYSQGKAIECKSEANTTWLLSVCPTWDEHLLYRVKPEEKYVRFENIEELISAWEKKCHSIERRPDYMMPLIWIKNNKTKAVHMITEFFPNKTYNDSEIGTESDYLTLKELFELYTFLDDTPCGKRVE